MFEAWATHTSLVVAGHDAAQTNYAMRVPVAFAAGMRADFRDLRFSTADDSTALTFWRGAYTSGVSAVFYVIVPSLPASGGTVTIRQHHGNDTVAYGGVALGANGVFASSAGAQLDGGSAGVIPHAAAGAIAPTPGAWDDRYVFNPRFVVNVDGSLHRDADGYAYVMYLGANAARDATIGNQGDDRPGFYRIRDFDTDTFEKVNTSDAAATWNNGTWHPRDGTWWNGRVVQPFGVVWTGTKYIMFSDGDRGYITGHTAVEDYTQGQFTKTPPIDDSLWTPNASNPTFQSGHANAGSYSDQIAYGGDIFYDPDEPIAARRWKNYYTGLNASNQWGVMLAYAPGDAEGPDLSGSGWTRHSTSYIYQPMTTGGKYAGGVDRAFKLRGITYLLWEQYNGAPGAPAYTHLAMSADGIAFTDAGIIFALEASGWDRGTQYWFDMAWDDEGGVWRGAYTGGPDGGPGGGGTDVGALQLGFTSWAGMPARLASEPTISTGGTPSMTVAPADGWVQTGHAITVNAPAGSRRTTSAVVWSNGGGVVQFSGGDASKFAASLDGSAWTSTITIPPGASTIHLSVTPTGADHHLSTSVGIPL